MYAKKPTSNLTIATANEKVGAKELVRCAKCHFRKKMYIDSNDSKVYVCSMFHFPVGADFFCACGFKDTSYEKEQREKGIER